jgi:hypothetical protein
MLAPPPPPPHQVDSVQAEGVRGPAYHLLRVVQQAELRPYRFKGQEVHLLPLVPDIITALHPEQQLLLVDPPEGKYCSVLQWVSSLVQQGFAYVAGVCP